jgi:hypothetical protein
MAVLMEKRKYPRYLINFPVFIFHTEKRAVAHTLDVGLGGMKIYTDKVFPLRRDFLFQLVLQRKSIWVKGRFIFKQTLDEFINFSSVRFEKIPEESIFDLNEFFFHSQNLLRKDFLDGEKQIQEVEAALAKANELLKGECERWKQGEQLINDISEGPKYLSSVDSSDREKIKLTVQALDERINALLLAITDGLNYINLFLQGENASCQISFEQIIFEVQDNYKEIRRILENLGPSIQEQLGILRSIGVKCKEIHNIYYGIQNKPQFLR